MPKAKIPYQKLNAGHSSPNGNPQRVYVFYSPKDGTILAVHDEGYAGTPRYLSYKGSYDPTTVFLELPGYDISKSDYRELLRDNKRVSESPEFIKLAERPVTKAYLID